MWIAADWLTYERKSVHFIPAFEATVRDIARDGRRVVIIGKAPIIPGYDRRCKQKAVMVPLLKCEYPDAPLSEKVRHVNARLAAMARDFENVSYFDANSILCPNEICPLQDEAGRLIYVDSSHITLDASWALGATIIRDGVPPPFRRDNQ